MSESATKPTNGKDSEQFDPTGGNKQSGSNPTHPKCPHHNASKPTSQYSAILTPIMPAGIVWMEKGWNFCVSLLFSHV